MISLNRIKSITVKEARHIKRDPQTLVIVIAMPLVMMFLYGYALDTEISEIDAAFIDTAPDRITRGIIRSIHNSELFNVKKVYQVKGDPDLIIKSLEVKAVFILETGFSRLVRKPGKNPVVSVVIDGSDPNVATVIKNSSEMAVREGLENLLGITGMSGISVKKNIFYNPQQKSVYFFIPGLMALILMMISALLTCVTITREKELGTMSQLLISPLGPSEIIIGKIIPYIFLAFLNGVIIMTAGVVIFSLPFKGGIFSMVFSSLVYIFTSLSIGLLISTLVEKQQHAMLGSIVITLMPTVIFSGFVFPIESMPGFVQAFTYIFPGRYYLEILREIILKGRGLVSLYQPFTVLVLQGCILLFVAVKRFKTRL